MSNPQGRARAFLLSLLGISVIAGITVAVLGTCVRPSLAPCRSSRSRFNYPSHELNPRRPIPYHTTGIYGKDIFPQKDGAWEDPNLSYVKVPSLDKLRADFVPDACFDNYDLDWTSGKDGQVYVNTAPFIIKGALLWR